MRRVFVILIAIGMSAPVVAQVVGARSSPSIAYISQQRILTESVEAKAAEKRLETLRQAKAQEVNAAQKVLDETRRELANTYAFRASRRAELRAQESRQQTALQQTTQQAQTDLQALQRELQTALRQRLKTILDDIAKRRPLQIVLNQDAAVVWAPAGLDLTAEVLAKLNETGGQQPREK